MRHRVWIAACLLLVLAFALRVGSIEHQPLHYDEGNNVYFGRLTFTGLLQETIRTSDTDPGGHRYALGFWMDAAGPSPFSIRLFSVAFSLLSVALTYRLARQLRLSTAASLIAAGLMAISPYAIDYGQQAKGYAMGAALALASWWCWFRLMNGVGNRGWKVIASGYIIVTAAMIGTHFYTVLVLGMQWVWALGAGRIHLSPRSWRNWVMGLGLQILAVLPGVVWLTYTLSSSLHGSVMISTDVPPLNPIEFWQFNLSEMSVGRFASLMLKLAGAIVFSALAVWGAASLWRTPDKVHRTAFWFGAALLVALLGAFVLQLRISFYSPRFLLFALPSLAILVAQPLASVAQPTGRRWVVAGLAAAGLSLAGMLALFIAPVDPELEMRGLIAQLRPYLRRDDAALGGYIWIQGLVESYAPETRGSLTWYEDRYSTDTLDALMRPVARHPRVWSFNFRRNPDAPDSLSVQWLKERGAEAGRFAAPSMQTVLFDLRFDGAGDANAIKSVAFHPSIQLDTARLNLQASTSQASAGDSIPILLRWTTTRPITEDLSIFVHLIGPDGQLIAQSDSAAVNGLAPSFTWAAGQPIADRRAILLPAHIAPGRYTVRVGLYRRSDQVRLQTSAGAGSGADSAEIGQIDIVSAKPTE